MIQTALGPALVLSMLLALALPSTPLIAAGALDDAASWEDRARRLEVGADPMAIVAELRGDAGTTKEVQEKRLACAPLPADGLPGLTNDRFYFLTEILEGEVPLSSPECGEQLACFLEHVSASPHGNATLVIDRQCVAERTLILPDRFTLAGVGISGEGVLVFDLPTQGVGLRFGEAGGVPNRLSMIRDLTLVNAGCCGQTGIELANSGFVDLERIQVTGFAIGVMGEYSYSVNITQSRFFDNGFNIVLGADTTTWRIRESTLSQSFLVGLVLGREARGHLFSGGRVESNPYAGILIQGPMNVIENSWFEGNGGASFDGIKISAFAEQNKILGNLLSSQEIANTHPSNTICFSMGFGDSADTCNID